MKTRTFSLLVMCFACAGPLAALVSAQPPSLRPARFQPPGEPTLIVLPEAPRELWKISTGEQAIDVAWRFLATQRQASVVVEVEQVKAGTDNSPYLHRAIAGREVWRVVLRGVNVDDRPVQPATIEDKAPPADGKTPAKARPAAMRDLCVLLDPESGGLLKLSTHDRQGEPREYTEPSGESATRQLFSWGIEQWIGVIEEPPATTFLEALRAIRGQGFATFEAQEIVAHAVHESENLRTNRLAWSIHTRGITPVQPNRDRSVTIKARNHLRHIVDATTGAWVGAGTTPQPDEPPKEKAPPPSSDRKPPG